MFTMPVAERTMCELKAGGKRQGGSRLWQRGPRLRLKAGGMRHDAERTTPLAESRWQVAGTS